MNHIFTESFISSTMEDTGDGEIFKSVIQFDPSKIPNVSYTDYIFTFVKKNLHAIADKPWLLDVCTEKKVLFREVEELTRKVASGLARRGFTKGDVLYFVAYNVVDIAILQLAVWLLGGVTRGSFQIEEIEEFSRQLSEVQCKFVAVDCETAQPLKKAISLSGISCKIINVGDSDIEGTLRFSDLTNDDGTAFPSAVEIDPKNDIILICNTSGSTGIPKGAIHTHETLVSVIASLEDLLPKDFDNSMLMTGSNFSITNVTFSTICFATGNTMFCVSRYKKEEFIGHLLKFKPRRLLLYPYITSWLARCPDLEKHDFSFLRDIAIGGAVVDPATMRLLQKSFPKSYLNMAYASTESLICSATLNSPKIQLPLFGTSPDGAEMVSSGILLPLLQAKIVDFETQKLLGRNKIGKLYIKAIHMMKGYLVGKGKEPNKSCFDEDGWFDTGDIAFFDSTGQLFVRERASFMFKYYMHFVNPSEIEAILHEHPAVHLACVIGVPNEETTNLAKAIVVLKDGEKATEEELLKLVASRLPFYKHLYGGVQFVDSLPESKGRKLDRVAITKAFS